MIPNGTFLFLPTSLGKTPERLDDVLRAWAERRAVSTLAYRSSGAQPLPGDGYAVWLAEVYGGEAIQLVTDLSVGGRSIVAVRLHDDGALLGVSVFREGQLASRVSVEPKDRAEAETVLGKALGAIAGPLDTVPGWFESMFESHAATSKLRVARWNGGHPASPEWPASYAPPEVYDSVDRELEEQIMRRVLEPQQAALHVHFDRIVAAHQTLEQVRTLEDETEISHARRTLASARLAFVSAVRAVTGPSGEHEAIRRAVIALLKRSGVRQRQAERLLGDALRARG